MKNENKLNPKYTKILLIFSTIGIVLIAGAVISVWSLLMQNEIIRGVMVDFDDEGLMGIGDAVLFIIVIAFTLVPLSILSIIKTLLTIKMIIQIIACNNSSLKGTNIKTLKNLLHINIILNIFLIIIIPFFTLLPMLSAIFLVLFGIGETIVISYARRNYLPAIANIENKKTGENQ